MGGVESLLDHPTARTPECQMSRKTFLNLITEYGAAEFELGACLDRPEPEREKIREHRDAARDLLRRSLRQAGIPLDQVTPQ